jgi:hypothetical protein
MVSPSWLDWALIWGHLRLHVNLWTCGAVLSAYEAEDVGSHPVMSGPGNGLCLTVNTPSLDCKLLHDSGTRSHWQSSRTCFTRHALSLDVGTAIRRVWLSRKFYVGTMSRSRLFVRRLLSRWQLTTAGTHRGLSTSSHLLLTPNTPSFYRDVTDQEHPTLQKTCGFLSGQGR